MNDIEKNKLTMCENIVTYLLEYRDIFSGNPSLLHAISQLRKAIDDIKMKDKELSSNTLERTLVADSARNELILALLPVSNSLFYYAKENADIGLKEKTRLSQSQLFRLKDNELIKKSTAIQFYALNNLSRLHKSGITKSLIQDLNKKTEKYKTALDSKIVSIVSNNTASSLSNSFLDAENIIQNQLDELVETYMDEYEEFYDDYLSIRTMENQEETEEEELEIEADE